jgi:hypothetical protein
MRMGGLIWWRCEYVSGVEVENRQGRMIDGSNWDMR